MPAVTFFFSGMLDGFTSRTGFLPRIHILRGTRRITAFTSNKLYTVHPLFIFPAHGTLRMNAGGRVARFPTDRAAFGRLPFEQRDWLFTRHNLTLTSAMEAFHEIRKVCDIFT